MATGNNTLLDLIRQFSKPALELVSIASPNQPNMERICLKTHQRVDLRDYIVLICFSIPGVEGVFPMPNLSFWLGADILDPGYWIILYTGSGERIFTRTTETNEPALVMHWNSPQTLFSNNNIVASLARLERDVIQIARLPHETQFPTQPSLPPSPWNPR